jgi:autophagy-related protein 17
MASPPAPTSPTSSHGSFEEPNLSQLVEYLLASKRSLSSLSLVWRARDIVDLGRGALEENAARYAQRTYVRHAVDGQLEALEAIRHGAAVADAEGYEEFEVHITAARCCLTIEATPPTKLCVRCTRLLSNQT